MFDRVLERHPGAIVTEYAWQANSCDPCPVPPLDPSELTVLLLGLLDVLELVLVLVVAARAEHTTKDDP